MKTIDQFVTELFDKGVRVWEQNGQMRVRAAKTVLTPGLRHQLRERKTEILSFLSEKTEDRGARSIEPVDRAGSLSLSFAQERLRFLEKLNPGSAYHIPLSFRLKGPLSAKSLVRAIREVIRRHEVLRTFFKEEREGPVQVIQSSDTRPIPFVDLSKLAGNRRGRIAETIFANAAIIPFHLNAAPPFRMVLVGLGPGHHWVSLVCHHVIADAWSLKILFGELKALYRAFLDGEPSPLPELKIQYADFACRQRQWFREGRFQAALAYWRTQLSPAPEVLELPPVPFDVRREQHLTHTESEAIPAEEIKALARFHDATPFMLLLASYFLLLQRVTQQSDLCVGTPVAGRNHLETEPLIGFFVNMLALRVDLSGNPDFRELLGRVGSACRSAFEHQELPFEKIVKELEPRRELDRPPFFRAAFNFLIDRRPIGENNEAFSGLALAGLNREAADEKFDLTLSIAEVGAGFRAQWHAGGGSLSPGVLRDMASAYRKILEGVLADPRRKIGTVPILTGRQRRRVLELARGPDRKWTTELPVHRIIANTARAQPDAVALVETEGQAPSRDGTGTDRFLSFGFLDRRSDSWAGGLTESGIGPERVVGLCMRPCPEVVVGLLAILKSGGIYLPISPSLPRLRIAHMLRDSDTALVLTRSEHLSKLDSTGTPVFHEDWMARQAKAKPAKEPVLPCGFEDIGAYLIFTSGSTGKPKGVCVTQRGLRNLYWACGQRYALSPADRLLQFCQLSFDKSLEEMLPTLGFGGSLIFAPDVQALTPERFQAQTDRLRITVLNIPTAYWRLWSERSAIAPDFPAYLRLVIVGGEKADGQTLKRWQANPRNRGLLLNAFGPTETTVTASWFHPGHESGSRTETLPIGRPIANTRIHILDRGLQLVLAGTRGGLFIEGPSLARGYWRQPELTATRFIPSPFADSPDRPEPGARLYRTGDLGYFRPSGNIGFLGREDEQLKIRGFRIEPGEIETALMGHESVSQAVVLPQETGGDRSLVAFIKPAARPGAPTVSALSAHLKALLPEYMVPNRFVFLDEIPVTAVGKWDRRALADLPARTEAKTPAPPMSSLEKRLAAVWARLLGREAIRLDDHFFELGGHSLAATRLVSEIEAAFQVDLPVRCVFEHPVLAEMARHLRDRIADGNAPGKRPIHRLDRRNRLPLSFAQQRLWFIDQLEPGSTAYNMPFLWRLEPHADPLLMERVFNELRRRHEGLRTCFPNVSGKPIQKILPFVPCPLSLIDLSGLTDLIKSSTAGRLARAVFRYGFDLGRGPLAVFHAARLSRVEQVLMFNLHHIVSDAWSNDILRREIALLAHAFARDRPSPLPDLEIQYADFAAWQREWLQGEVLEAQLNYWKNRLGGEPAVLELPTDRPYCPQSSRVGAFHHFQFPLETSSALRSLSNERGCTPFMTLLAAFQVLLHRYSGQQDISVGVPIAGRNHLQTEKVVGFFVNTLVMRANLTRKNGQLPNFIEFLGQVRETTLDAYAHQDIPFEKLVEELQPVRDMTRTPLFQVMFNFLEGTKAHDAFPSPWKEVDADPNPDRFSQPLMPAQFELTLTIMDRPCFLAMLNFQTRLFDTATMIRLAGHFSALIAAVVQDPDRRLDRMMLLNPWEKHQLLREWNQTGTAFPETRTLHGTFSLQAERTPDRVALASEDRTLTYGFLRSNAQRLAAQLQTLGVAAETPVGLWADRSAASIPGLFGILMAGGCYVALDPLQPERRLAWILRDAGATVLLARARNRKKLDEWEGACLEPMVGFSAGNRLRLLGSSRQLAYILYTSGSTGFPKGVMVDHRSVLNLRTGLRHAVAGYGDKKPLRAGLNAPLVFDASIQQVLTLLGGHILCPVPGEIRMEGARFAAWLVARRIQLLDGTPAQMKMVFSDRNADCFAGTSLRVVVGGDRVETPLLRKLAGFDGVRFHNVYGPTECTVNLTSWRMAPNAAVPLIGRPLANCRLQVLDPALRLVPLGVPGELLAGGPSLARGYRARPDLTAPFFVPDPFAIAPGARCYRTGDLVRYRPPGDLEFLGRIDHQVKLRGFRIELGEIEAMLGAQPGIKACCVLVCEMGPDDRRLVAFLVSEKGKALSPQALGKALAKQLPGYMLPNRYIERQSLPMTPSGKVDRKALSAIPCTEMASNKALAAQGAPGDPVEETLWALWADVMQQEPAGIHQNFFEAGGHSLLATRLVSRVREAFRVELPLKAIFAEPTVAGLASILRDLLATGHPRSALPIRPMSRKRDLPLSFAQQRLWLIDQLDPGSIAYNMPFLWRTDAHSDPLVMERVFNELRHRHEGLRTCFPNVSGTPVQKILPFEPRLLSLIDLGGLAGETRHRTAGHLGQALFHHRFDLARGPLAVFHAVRPGPGELVLMVNLHHIVSDAWSNDILRREIAILSKAYLKGGPPTLSDLEVHYADYSAWQRKWLKGEVLEIQLRYWKNRLAGAPAVLELPTDRPHRPNLPAAGEVHGFRIPPTVSSSLRLLSRNRGCTPFMTLLAAFQILLSRYSGQDDLCVGVPVAGRNHAQLENVVGFFVNTLVMRAKFPHPKGRSPSFTEILARTRETTLDAYAHQDIPFEKLVEELQPVRDMTRTPLFQVMFNFLKPAGSADAFPFASKRVQADPMREPFEPPKMPAQFELSLSVVDTPALSVELSYKTGLFDATTVKRLARHFTSLVTSISLHPEQRLDRLKILSPVEKHHLLREWNQTRTAFPENRTLHGIFTGQARRTPERVALTALGQSLTYGFLSAECQRLGAHLQRLGVTAETPVGLCVDRSTKLFVGLFGILMAGGCYLALDPYQPESRLAWILRDARVPVVLTRTRFRDRLGDFRGGRVDLELEVRNGNGVCVEGSPYHLAYILYTSGSTGRPKGVMIDHRSVLNLRTGLRRSVFPARENGPLRTALNAPLVFDASVQLVLTLLDGYSLCLVPRNVRLEGARLANWLVERRIQLLDGTPVQMNMMFSGLDANFFSRTSLTVLVGGEQIEVSLLRTLARMEGVSFYNLYGPTECAVEVTFWRLERNAATSLLGKPFANRRLHVLGRRPEPIPVGVPGELQISGIGLGRGYRFRPDLTAGVFIPNPFAGEPGERLYRTGDLVRYRSEGDLEFLGRIDHQVKLRGFRIELGEIEAVLGTQPGVQACCVLVREMGSGDQRLLAFLVLEKGFELSPESIRRKLAEQLPGYMIPNTFLALEAFPLTHNGKVDRKALSRIPPAGLELHGSDSAHESTPQVGPGPDLENSHLGIEPVLAQIWKDVLNRERVGVHDNFFNLGGHSLLASRVISRINEAFSVNLPVRALFETPTIEGLCRYLVENASKRLALPPIEPLPREPRPQPSHFPLSFAQQRLWFLEQMEERNPAYHISTGLRVKGYLQAEALRQALFAMIRRHESLRTSFKVVDGEPVQVVHADARLNFSVVDRTGLDTKTYPERLAEQEARLPFDLAAHPLFRVTLVHLGPEEYTLLITMHHIVSDGWSSDILVRETVHFYERYLGNPGPDPQTDLPKLWVQYADFAQWQRQWMRGDAMAYLLDYWKQCLLGAPPLLDLPTDRLRPSRLAHEGKAVDFVLTPGLTRLLRALARSQDATMFMVLLSAYASLLSHYTGQDDLVIGTPIANRNRTELESLIGFLINTLPLRIDLGGGPGFIALLKRVRALSLEAYAHQDLPFERIVEALQIKRDLSYTALFQTMLAFQNTPRSEVRLSQISLSPLGSGDQSSKFDITLYLTESKDVLTGSFVYRTSLFERATIKNMAARFETLLKAIVAIPDRPVAKLPLLTQEERNTVLNQWNRAGSQCPRHPYLHRIFEESARIAPDALALTLAASQPVGGERRILAAARSMTFSMLNNGANRLAHELVRQGIVPDRLVGVSLPRSVELVIALLAIHKAGGAYLVLAPELPRERCRAMIEGVGLSLLLEGEPFADDRIAGTFPRLAVGPFVNSTEPIGFPRVEPLPENAAYVVFTSGSTGRPKGILAHHRGVANYVGYLAESFSLNRRDRVLQLAPTTFDASVRDLLSPLALGCSVVVPRDSRDPSAILNHIRDHRITCLPSVVPTMLTALVEAARNHGRKCTGLRLILVSGEVLTPSLCVLSREHFSPSARIVHQYGPSECTMTSTFYPVPKVPDRRGRLSLGSPIPNARFLILDRWFEPVGKGIPGQAAIGGIGLARAYLGKPDLTAEKFVPDAFSGMPGLLLFLTGDLVRCLVAQRDSDRSSREPIHFLSRIDRQVKIRGFRIEPGEIERMLQRYTGIREAVVLVREKDSRERHIERRLIAYLVPDADRAPDPERLRRFLGTMLPDYMVPAGFVVLDRIPLTPHGKVDRIRLQGTPDQKVDGIPSPGLTIPRNDIELRMARIWEDLLDLEPVGIESDFFELGGHSILAIRLMDRVRQEFGKNLPLASLFDNRTVSRFARLLSGSLKHSNRSPLVPIKAGGKGPTLFFMHPIGGNVFCYAALARHLGMPCYGLQSPGLYTTPLTRIEEMAACYRRALQRVQPKGPYFLGGWSLGGLIAFETALQLCRRGFEVARLFLIDAHLFPSSSSKPKMDGRHQLAAFARDLAGLSGKKIPPLKAPHSQNPHQQWAQFREAAQKLGLVTGEEGHFRQLWRVYQANLRAGLHYRPRASELSALLIRATEEIPNRDPAPGWQSLLSGGLTVRDLPGNHHSLMHEPRVKDLAKLLKSHLAPAPEKA